MAKPLLAGFVSDVCGCLSFSVVNLSDAHPLHKLSFRILVTSSSPGFQLHLVNIFGQNSITLGWTLLFLYFFSRLAFRIVNKRGKMVNGVVSMTVSGVPCQTCGCTPKRIESTRRNNCAVHETNWGLGRKTIRRGKTICIPFVNCCYPFHRHGDAGDVRNWYMYLKHFNPPNTYRFRLSAFERIQLNLRSRFSLFDVGAAVSVKQRGSEISATKDCSHASTCVCLYNFLLFFPIDDLLSREFQISFRHLITGSLFIKFLMFTGPFLLLSMRCFYSSACCWSF